MFCLQTVTMVWVVFPQNGWSTLQEVNIHKSTLTGNILMFWRWHVKVQHVIHVVTFALGCRIPNIAPIVERVDNAIHRRKFYLANNAMLFPLILIWWIRIYSVDSTIQSLNNWGLITKESQWKVVDFLLQLPVIATSRIINQKC